MHSRIRKELKYLRRRVEILDGVIASLEDLQQAAERANPATTELRLYRCVDRSSSHGIVRGEGRAAALGENFR
jgi:hypothetical protein